MECFRDKESSRRNPRSRYPDWVGKKSGTLVSWVMPAKVSIGATTNPTKMGAPSDHPEVNYVSPRHKVPSEPMEREFLSIKTEAKTNFSSKILAGRV